MVCLWLLGDIGKTVYFVVRHTPAQFWVCGLMQITIDVIIITQVGVPGWELVSDNTGHLDYTDWGLGGRMDGGH